jgi:hypothetical protein
MLGRAGMEWETDANAKIDRKFNVPIQFAGQVDGKLGFEIPL